MTIASEKKIFCVGMPRTGTSSLVTAGRMLGLKSAHLNQHYAGNRFGLSSQKQNRITEQDAAHIARYDLFADFPIPCLVGSLHRAYPDAYFIHTIRNPDTWLASFRRLAPMTPVNLYHEYHAFWRTIAFGDHYMRNKAQEQHFKQRYIDNNISINNYFIRHPEARYLRWALTDRPEWRILCGFLGLPEPNVQFPKVHVIDRRGGCEMVFAGEFGRRLYDGIQRGRLQPWP